MTPIGCQAEYIKLLFPETEPIDLFYLDSVSSVDFIT